MNEINDKRRCECIRIFNLLLYLQTLLNGNAVLMAKAHLSFCSSHLFCLRSHLTISHSEASVEYVLHGI